MKSRYIHVGVLMLISLVSFFLFEVNKWEYFYGKSYIVELLITVVVVVLSGLLIFLKFRPFSQKQIFAIISVLIMDLSCVVLSIATTHGVTNMSYYQTLHLLSFLLMFKVCEKRKVFTILSAVMIFCSPIAYRMDTIGWVSHDYETMAVGNFAMLVSVGVLFIVNSVVLLVKRFQED